MRAKLVWFYGFSHQEFEDMDVPTTSAYWQAINAIEAQEMLKANQSADYPNLKSQAKKKQFKKLRKQAYPTEEKRAISPADMAKILKQSGA